MEEERTAHMQFIQTFLQSSVKEEAQKVQFLHAVSSLCTAARDQGFLEELKEFCEQHQVAENIKALVEEEPMDHVHTVVRQQAMLTLAQMSKVQMLLKRKKKSLLTSCFRKVFLLPPITSRKGKDSFLYFQVSAVGLPGAFRAAPWLASAEPQPAIHGTIGSRLYYPTLVPSSPPCGPCHAQSLWTGSSARCSLSAPRCPLATQRWQGCPPHGVGVRSLPGERRTAERLT
ncbi:uncharacterized protein LOC133217856 [Neopsephotus bourkii]|uniref:uncharacterized protein LOC133217856 n=1 Tax=Neopsephotus bourkii TaxID=309878 RepID=UPI002AA50B80|nr:uncharacterized protein LOC133217856 [Neopsephotus bourkii]